MNTKIDKNTLSYIIGIAIGDGNLSNPGNYTTRLRITCDKKYKNIIREIISSIQKILPNSKISLIKRKESCLDISCYSNEWEALLGWKAGHGSKIKQRVSVPHWIKDDKDLSIKCLKGLFQTDGSIYLDRGYKMINFTTAIFALANDVTEMINTLGFKSHLYTFKKLNSARKTKYTIRISKDVEKFVNLMGLYKN